MEKLITQLHQILQKLTGLHRQLMETVRAERDALISADLKEIQIQTFSKQTIIEEIHHTESARLKLMADLAIQWNKPIQELTLPNIIIEVQGTDLKAAEQLRTTFNALTILIQRISTQNKDNRVLVEHSLEHVYQMKKNILGESSPRTNTYTQQGQSVNGPAVSRILSREA